MTTPARDSPQSSDRLRGVIRAQTEIANLGLDLGAVMALVTQRVLDLTPAAGAVVELLEGDEMVYRATSGAAEPHLGLRLASENSLSGLCIASNATLICDDSDSDPRVDQEACRLIGLRSMIVVPLRHDADVVGVLKVFSPAPHTFDRSDVEILGLISELIGSAMFHSTQNESGALFHRATHDGLTGLSNRALFYDRLRHTLATASRDDQNFAVLSLDMDGLKTINDTWGHRTGDAAICEVANRIGAVSRQSDTVSRLGGDEFGVILAHPSDQKSVLAHSERLAKAMEDPFELDDHRFDLSVSTGFAVFPDDGNDVAALLDRADQTMYDVKRERTHR